MIRRALWIKSSWLRAVVEAFIHDRRTSYPIMFRIWALYTVTLLAISFSHRSNFFCPALFGMSETLLFHTSLLSTVTPSIRIDNSRALHFVDSKVPFLFVGHSIIFSRFLFRPATTTLAHSRSFVAFIGANSMESSAYSIAGFHKCQRDHLWTQKIKQGKEWNPEAPGQAWKSEMSDDWPERTSLIDSPPR